MSIIKLDMMVFLLQKANIFDNWIPYNPKTKKICAGSFLALLQFPSRRAETEFRIVERVSYREWQREACGAKIFTNKSCTPMGQLGC